MVAVGAGERCLRADIGQDSVRQGGAAARRVDVHPERLRVALEQRQMPGGEHSLVLLGVLRRDRVEHGVGSERVGVADLRIDRVGLRQPPGPGRNRAVGVPGALGADRRQVAVEPGDLAGRQLRAEDRAASPKASPRVRRNDTCLLFMITLLLLFPGFRGLASRAASRSVEIVALEHEDVRAGGEHREAHALLVVDAQDDHLDLGTSLPQLMQPAHAAVERQGQVHDSHVGPQP